MFIVLVSLEAKADDAYSVSQLLKSQAAQSLESEPGCRQFDVLTDVMQKSHFLLYEIYDSKQAFDDHLNMSHTTSFLNAVKPLILKKEEQHLIPA